MCISRGNCQNLFIGRTLQQFLADNIEGYTVAMEVDCLKQKLGTAYDILQENTIEKKDIQPWELVALFDNVVENAVLCWFYSVVNNF